MKQEGKTVDRQQVGDRWTRDLGQETRQVRRQGLEGG